VPLPTFPPQIHIKKGGIADIMKNCTRREFVTKGAALLALPTVAQALDTKQGPKIGSLPIIFCSRGEEWGRQVLEPAWQVWLQSHNMLDAVEKGANVVELDPNDQSVGYGGYPNEEGVVELDASIMSGPSHKCGSVASLRNIKTPCSVARVVMERTDHIMLVGDGARRFAIAHGFKEENLLTEKSRVDWLRWKENLSKDDDWFPPADNDYSKEFRDRSTGTINVLGIDDKGDVFGITTTSGLAFKIPGRIGDSPVIGAGLYLDNEVGAAGATGRGEEVIRTCGSFLVVEKMSAGLSPQEACEFALKRILQVNNGKADFEVKFVAVNKKGVVGCAQIHKSRGPNCSFITSEGFRAIEGGFLME